MPDIILDVTTDEYEKAGASKFPAEGLHLSEMGMPDWETAGKSIRFPFTIVEEGEDNGKEGKLVAGVSLNAVWKIKEILNAIGVEATNKDGKVSFDPASCVGKQFKSVWVTEQDKRLPAEGGTGGFYVKVKGAVPADTESSDVGI